MSSSSSDMDVSFTGDSDPVLGKRLRSMASMARPRGGNRTSSGSSPSPPLSDWSPGESSSPSSPHKRRKLRAAKTAKDELQQFYTPSQVAAQMYDLALTRGATLPCEIFVEPSVGKGAFVKALPANKVIIGIDVDPDVEELKLAAQGKHFQLKHMDFFDFTADQIPGYREDRSGNSNTCVVGNPPWKKAVEFFNHAAQFAQTIAMIFPPTFGLSSTMAKLDRNFHLVLSHPLNCTFYKASRGNMCIPSVFQVWERNSISKKFSHPALYASEVMRKLHIHTVRASQSHLYPAERMVVVKHTRTDKDPIVAYSGPAWLQKTAGKTFPMSTLQNYVYLYLQPDSTNTADQIVQHLNQYADRYHHHFLRMGPKWFVWTKSDIMAALLNKPPEGFFARAGTEPSLPGTPSNDGSVAERILNLAMNNIQQQRSVLHRIQRDVENWMSSPPERKQHPGFWDEELETGLRMGDGVPFPYPELLDYLANSDQDDLEFHVLGMIPWNNKALQDALLFAHMDYDSMGFRIEPDPTRESGVFLPLLVSVANPHQIVLRNVEEETFVFELDSDLNTWKTPHNYASPHILVLQ